MSDASRLALRTRIVALQSELTDLLRQESEANDADLGATKAICLELAKTNKVAAVKLYREKTGLTLAESLRAIKQLQDQCSAGRVLCERLPDGYCARCHSDMYP